MMLLKPAAVPGIASDVPVILPLVMRHAEDAAFYWMQRDANACSALLSFERLAHFDRLLNAHLDGLRVADDPGWELALKNLQRWRSNGESFVAWVLLLEKGSEQRLDALWSLSKNHPDSTYRGLISALAWVEPEQATPWLELWLAGTEFASLQMLALRAYAAGGMAPEIGLDEFFDSDHVFLRAAACNLAGRARLYDYNARLHAARQDFDSTVRCAAGLALYRQGEGALVATELWHALQQLNQTANKARGLAQQQWQNRALMLARQLGHAFPVNHFDWSQVVKMLPPRQVITLFAHHGDPAMIPYLLHFAQTPELNRLASWALAMITGLDLAAAGLTRKPTEADDDERRVPLSDPDVGLPWTDANALLAWWQQHYQNYNAGERLLLGRAVTDQAANLALLQHGTQVQRFAAAAHFAQANPDLPALETRAAALRQQRWIDQIETLRQASLTK